MSQVSEIQDALDRIKALIEDHVQDPGVKVTLTELCASVEMSTAKAIIQASTSKPTTFPWVEALHTMGRQILNAATLIIATILIFQGHEFTQYDILLLGGPNLAYQLIKGKGKQKQR